MEDLFSDQAEDIDDGNGSVAKTDQPEGSQHVDLKTNEGIGESRNLRTNDSNMLLTLLLLEKIEETADDEETSIANDQNLMTVDNVEEEDHLHFFK